MPCIAKNHSKNYSFQSCKPRFTPLPIPTVLIKQIHQLINNFPEAVVVLSLGDLFAYLFVSLCLLWQTNMFFLNQRTWNGKNSQSGSRWRVWVFQKGFAFISERKENDHEISSRKLTATAFCLWCQHWSIRGFAAPMFWALVTYQSNIEDNVSLSLYLPQLNDSKAKTANFSPTEYLLSPPKPLFSLKNDQMLIKIMESPQKKDFLFKKCSNLGIVNSYFTTFDYHLYLRYCYFCIHENAHMSC